MKTTIDYVQFRTLSNPWQVLDAITPSTELPASLLSLGEQQRGKDGWQDRREVLVGEPKDSHAIASLDYGGDSQRGWLRFRLSGKNCPWIRDWKMFSDALQTLESVELQRVDIALTVADGSVSHEIALKAWHDGLFTNGGRPPKHREIRPSDPTDGFTFEVGTRKDSHKFCRCYEKGWEELKDLPSYMKKQGISIDYPGLGIVPVEHLYRVEVEFKNAGKILPFSMLTDPDSYFAGAYPFCASLLPSAPVRKPVGLPDFGARVALEAQTENARRAYGKLVRTLYDIHGGDADKVLSMLMADSPSDRLVRAGVLTMAHE